MPDTPDKLTLDFTREEAFQFLTVLTVLNAIEAIHTPGLCQRPEVVLEKIGQLQSFVEGKS